MKHKYKKAMGLMLLTIPATAMVMNITTPLEANAETKSEQNAIEWIKDNWLNYPDATGKWTVAKVNGNTALGTTQNVQWTGYLNTHAMQTTDATFEFKMFQNESGDNDNMGWTFRHTYTGSDKDFKNHSFYTFISNANGAIPSGIYKKEVGKGISFSGTELTKLQTFTHVRKSKTEYAVKIDIKDEVGGTRIKAWIDGKLVADVLDTKPLVAGGYGPFSYSQAHAYYYDINVNGASFLNIPPTIEIIDPIPDGEILSPGDVIPVEGYVNDKDNTGEISTYYKIDKGEPQLISTNTQTGENIRFSKDIVIPDDLAYGEHTLYIYSKDSENGESNKKEIKFFIRDTFKPTVTHTLSNPEFTEEEITIHLSAKDIETGIKRIKLPDGNYTTDANVNFQVNENGRYTFVVEDNEGNILDYVVEISNFTKGYEYMVEVIGTFETTTIDVSIPATMSFLYNPNTNDFTAQDMNVINGTNAPLYMKLEEISIADDSTWKPAIVLPDKYTVAEWNNLTQKETEKEIALGLSAPNSNRWLKDVETSLIWNGQFNEGVKIGVIKNKETVVAQPTLKAGTSLPTSEILKTNYVFEFGLE